MNSNYFIQAPDEVRIYQQSINGDTVASAEWTLTPSAGVIITSPTNAFDTSSVFISGLQAGIDYIGRVIITCISSQVLDAAFTISCQIPQSPH